MHTPLRCILLTALLLASWPGTVSAQSAAPVTYPAAAQLDDAVLVAEVELDGALLFRVRGVSAMPATERVRQIESRLIALANDPAVDARAGAALPEGEQVRLEIDGRHLATIYPVDAAIEQVPLDVLAGVILDRVSAAIEHYRKARSARSLLTSTGVLVAISVFAALLAYGLNALFGWLNGLIERLVKKRIEQIEKASHRVIDAAQLWSWFGSLLRGVRTLALVAIALTWLNASLGLYPWTRPFAASIFRLILDPLKALGIGTLQALPDLAFLAVLTVVVRFLLKAFKTFFERIDRGWIRLNRFERDWAMPTYRIVRILVIAFALVVAYPYIPGSDSEAFKGVSIFLGVVFSIGSSSFIANMIAGYSLTYRGAFREGDRVKIGEHTGEVVDVRGLSTTLRSWKNEEINIPNSEVLSSAVVNYSAYQRERGLILHTDVGIGYDTPWRQVEAMLLLAAARTEGVETDPAPFVLQRALGDFTAVYQLNAFCRDAGSMMRVYSALHASIQDVFNEYGVQIMSPNYESDPAAPKVVPREQWYAAPAAPPEPPPGGQVT